MNTWLLVARKENQFSPQLMQFKLIQKCGKPTIASKLEAEKFFDTEIRLCDFQ